MLSPQATNFLAAAVLIASVVGVVVWAVIEKRKKPYTWLQVVIYFVNLLFCKILWRTKIFGSIDLPPGQGAVMVCNHRGSIDPVFFQLVSGRVVSWFVAREYCELPLVGNFLRATEVIPTNRGGIDTKAVRIAMRKTAAGRLVGMIPEGRINTTNELLLPLRPGVAMVALTTRVPVIPCFTQDVPYDGTYWGCLFMPAKVKIYVGEPLDFSEFYGQEKDRQVLEHVTKIIMQHVTALAGYTDYEPVMAGRHWKTVDHNAANNQPVAVGASDA